MQLMVFLHARVNVCIETSCLKAASGAGDNAGERLRGRLPVAGAEQPQAGDGWLRRQPGHRRAAHQPVQQQPAALRDARERPAADPPGLAVGRLRGAPAGLPPAGPADDAHAKGGEFSPPSYTSGFSNQSFICQFRHSHCARETVQSRVSLFFIDELSIINLGLVRSLIFMICTSFLQKFEVFTPKEVCIKIIESS